MSGGPFSKTITTLSVVVGVFCAALDGYGVATEILQNGKRGIVGFLYGPVVYLALFVIMAWTLGALRSRHPWQFSTWTLTALGLAGVIVSVVFDLP